MTIRSALRLIAVLALATGCGSTTAGGPTPKSSPDTACTAIFRSQGLSPSQVDSARQGEQCQAQDLRLSGELQGNVGSAYLGELGKPCQTPTFGDDFPNVALTFVVARHPYRLELRLPGHYRDAPATTTDLSNATISPVPSGTGWTGTSGTLSASDDGTHGTLDADFRRDVSDARPLHVSGSWRCGRDNPVPQADASVPCSQYYADAGLTPDQVQGLSRFCLPQDLSISGLLSFHVDHAINDADHRPTNRADFSSGNVCGADGLSYRASVGFTWRRETYELVFGILSTSPLFDKPVRPGTYPVAGGGEPYASLALATPGPKGSQVEGGVGGQWDAFAGSFTIAADMKSGSMQMKLGNGETRGEEFDVTGNWRCGA